MRWESIGIELEWLDDAEERRKEDEITDVAVFLNTKMVAFSPAAGLG